MEEYLLKVISKLKGSLIAVSVENESLLNAIDKNTNINSTYELKEHKHKLSKEEKTQGKKTININKFFKKNKLKVNYIICDVNIIDRYLKNVINISLKLVDKQIIFYGKINEYDVDRIVKRYQRYKIKFTKKLFEDGFVLIIDTNNIKTNKLKMSIYKIIDFFGDMLESIGNGLMG